MEAAEEAAEEEGGGGLCASEGLAWLEMLRVGGAETRGEVLRTGSLCFVIMRYWISVSKKRQLRSDMCTRVCTGMCVLVWPAAVLVAH